MTIITAVAKKREDTSAMKGELMLNNVDLMEVCVVFTPNIRTLYQRNVKEEYLVIIMG